MKPKLRIPAWPVLFATTVMSAIGAKIDGWDSSPETQYHVQTDEGAERFFRYQTLSGQYRKEKRLQDGTVVGSYGWVDADGYLRLNDYVADDRGYRVLRAKRLFVGGRTPPPATAATAPSASAAATAYRPYGYPPDQSKYLLFPSSSPSPLPVEARRRPTPPAGYYPTSTPPSVRPASASARPESAAVAITPRYHVPAAAAPAKYRYSAYETPSYTRPESGRNSAQPYHRHRQPAYAYPAAHRKSYGGDDDDDEAPNYEAVAVTTGNNGFRYYLPRQYHEERQSSGAPDERVGSFGYVDPFGIRRVVYYKASPGAGFAHRKSNRYVGLDGPPFDPTPPPPPPPPQPTTWPQLPSDHSSLTSYPL